jgi:uncharacterized protein (UPF0548 family)
MTVGSTSTPAGSMTSQRAEELSPAMRRRLTALHDAPVNYDPASLDLEHPPAGWHVDDRCQPLESEAPGPPASDGSWEIAGRLISGYEFADPSLVRAYYDQDTRLLGREMVLELRALNLISVHVGVRVVEVHDEVRTIDGRTVSVFGWSYRTLRGHVERGQMTWQVFKWQDTGAVEFRVHAVSRPAPIRNPVIQLGFLLLRGHERRTFLQSTDYRMRELTAIALHADDPAEAVRRASSELTTRHYHAQSLGHGRLGRRADPGSD